MNLPGFNRTIFYALGACFALDMFAILMDMTKVDLLLRPTILVLLVIQGVLWIRSGGGRLPYYLILLGLLVAIPNEVLQRFYGMGGQSIIGTSIYYALFFLAFATLRLVALSWRIVIPFAVLAVYMLVLFFIINPMTYRQEAATYMGVTTLMLGFAFYPLMIDRGIAKGRVLALGGVLLLLSDSIRAYVFLTMGYYAGTFLVNQLLEAVIVGLFFLGHFCVVQVIRDSRD